MSTATVTTKGQVTIPVDVRSKLQIGAGDRIEFVEVSPGRFEVVAATQSVKALKGLFGKAKRVVSIEEMNAAIIKRAIQRSR
jgi:antitoxin PrlF